tara:strand:+ start:5112 stop:6164 length:1053 start_codon:yes stop_codon:yes gene_type:complete
MDINFNSSKICCISDIHIGVHQNSAQWHDITLEWAKWLTTELESKGITDIVISGDFFHYRDEIAVNTIHFVSEVLSLWKDFNIVMLVGNHDAYYKDRSDVNSLSIIRGWNNVIIADSLETTTQYGKKITFCPWGTTLDQIPVCDIIFGHFEISSFKQNSFKICDVGLSAKELLAKCPLIVSGHFHLRDERYYDKGTILYLGNPFQMDFGDVGSDKGYYILDIPTGEFEFTENLGSPRHKKVLLSELVAIGKITDSVREDFKGNFIKFIIDKNISPDEVDIVLNKLLLLKPLSINVDYSVNFNKYNLYDDNKTDFSGIDVKTAIEEFINLMDIDNKKTVSDYTLDVYRQCT